MNEDDGKLFNGSQPDGLLEKRLADDTLILRTYLSGGELNGETRSWGYNGNPVSLGVFANGERTGSHVYWNDNSISEIANYKDGRRHGISIVISGNTRNVCHYTDGKENGLSEKYNRGVLVSRGIWEDGNRVMAIMWRLNGHVERLYDRDTTFCEIWTDGRLRSIEQFIRINGFTLCHGIRQTNETKTYYSFGNEISENDYNLRLQSTGAHVAETTPLLPQLGYLVSCYAEVIGTLQELNMGTADMCGGREMLDELFRN